jgi:hypothetical protein
MSKNKAITQNLKDAKKLIKERDEMKTKQLISLRRDSASIWN